MRDVLPTVMQWLERGHRLVMARVITTWGSSPRGVGSVMIIRDDRQVCGSVSGGCIEGAVIQAAETVLTTGRPVVLEFGVDDERAWSVGLSCGGRIRVLVEPHFNFTGRAEDRQIWNRLITALDANEPALVLTWLSPRQYHHCLVLNPDRSPSGKPLSPNLQKALPTFWQQQRSRVITVDGEEIFLHFFPRKPVLLLIGAAHISLPLIKFARELEFVTIVVDPRKLFASGERFEVLPDVLDNRWPQEALRELPLHEETYAVTLTHDPKIDDPALEILLRSSVAYVGALGSRRTHERRIKRLLQAGLTKDQLKRIHAPVGLPIDAQSPVEIALSIMTQIVQKRNQFLQRRRV